jgi:hypothetical protein
MIVHGRERDDRLLAEPHRALVRDHSVLTMSRSGARADVRGVDLSTSLASLSGRITFGQTVTARSMLARQRVVGDAVQLP